jgi:outer membrane immunogenic protein
MKKFVLVGAALAALLVTPAMSADMPAKAPSAPSYVPPAPSWTGLYVGANIGYMWAKTTGNFAPFNTQFPWDAPYNSAFGGAQVGFNWQFYQFVIGVEASLDGNINGKRGSTVGNSLAGPCGFPPSTSCQANIAYVSSVGGRLGWTPWSQWLFFAQGGWANADISTNGLINGTNTVFSPTSTHRQNGWFVGGGVDFAITPIVSIGVDYKHYDFNSDTHPDVLLSHNNDRVIKATADAVFARVNIKLWGPGGVIH